MEDRQNRSQEDCTGLLKKIFGKPENLLNKTAPDGWKNSSLFFVHHPTEEEQSERASAFRENLDSLHGLSKNAGKGLSPAPRPEVEVQVPDQSPAQPFDEFIDILGHCIWHVFSDNHDVVDAEGKAFHLGSWRGAAGFIADFINQHFPVGKCYGYMDFYMGFWYEEDRVKCFPVFIHIFEILKSEGLDWVYSFPGVYIVDFEKGDNAPDDPANYNPNKAMAGTIEKEERTKKFEQLKADLEKTREAEMEEARYKAPPVAVQAYRKVFGRLPEGFPD
ncbi:MAG TPA: hypothetical protein ENJ95_12430 [Bacteroidetes bacterium]|nr:hypothetical protein [Bacteroidota bacterium]